MVLTVTGVTGVTGVTAGVPFVSDSALRSGLESAGVDPTVSDAVITENAKARVQGLDTALGVLAFLAVVALGFTARIPDEAATSELQPSEP